MKTLKLDRAMGARGKMPGKAAAEMKLKIGSFELTIGTMFLWVVLQALGLL